MSAARGGVATKPVHNKASTCRAHERVATERRQVGRTHAGEGDVPDRRPTQSEHATDRTSPPGQRHPSQSFTPSTTPPSAAFRSRHRGGSPRTLSFARNLQIRQHVARYQYLTPVFGLQTSGFRPCERRKTHARLPSCRVGSFIIHRALSSANHGAPGLRSAIDEAHRDSCGRGTGRRRT